MNRHHLYSAITNIQGRLVATLLSATLLGMLPASNSWGDTSESNLKSASTHYLNGLGRLGTPMTFLTGTPPKRSIGIGDADGDGHTDLVVAEAESTPWWVLSGDGFGGFGAPTIMPTGARQKVVASGDLNADGINDQAVMERFATSARLLFGDGTGGFHKAGSSGKSTSGAVLVADFNSDGKHDLAVIDGKSNQVMVSLGADEGDYGAETPVSVGTVPDVLATGDFNQDGAIDLVLGSSRDKSVAILLGNQNGGFVPAQEFQMDLQPVSLAVGDLNGDGMADVAVADRRANHLSILFGDGTGGFLAPSAIIMPASFGADADVVSDSRRKGSGNDDANLSSGLSTSDPATGSYPNVYEGVAALTLNPATIVGGSGASTTGTITLNAPAPAGGVVVTLASSNLDLAASVSSITVPAGATTATFTVATNALYRRYSGLAFSVTISATHAATRSATLNVTAQARPGGFPSDSNQRSGRMCGGAFPASQGERGILFDCTLAPNFGTTGTCTFRQECTLGCQTVQAQSFTGFRHICATTPPFPVTLTPRLVTGGGAVAGTVNFTTASQPAPLDARASIFSNNPVATILPSGFLPVPTGAASVSFSVSTTQVNSPAFASIGVSALSPQSVNGGSVFLAERLGLAWLTVIPTTGVQPTPTLSTLTANPTSVVGGNPSQGTVTLTSAAPAGGAVVMLSDNSAAATVPTSVTVPAGASSATFVITTTSVTASTTATISATFAGITRTATLAITPASSGPLPAPSLLSPASDVRFSPGQAITFDWSDVTGAASYTIQIDDSNVFTTPLIVSQTLMVSQTAHSTLPTQRMWWRVRANDTAGTPGAWSVVRRFEIK